MFSARRAVCVGMMILVPLAIGCGKGEKVRESKRAVAKGMVTLDGKPLRGGSVNIVSAEDSKYRVSTPIRSGGEFAVADAPRGRVLISVDTEAVRIGNPSAFVEIPAKYAKTKTSGLTATISDEGDQLIAIELKSK